MEEIRVNVEQKNGVIGFNFEEIKEKLNSELEIYKNMIFTNLLTQFKFVKIF